MKQLTITLNPCTELKNERYNGGWTKSVTGLDETKKNGYSILGDFQNNNANDIYNIGGLYLDCDIHGSKKSPKKYYVLFTVLSDGTIVTIDTAADGVDWALNLRPAIKKFLNGTKTINPFDGFSDEEILAEAKKRGLI